MAGGADGGRPASARLRRGPAAACAAGRGQPRIGAGAWLRLVAAAVGVLLVAAPAAHADGGKNRIRSMTHAPAKNGPRGATTVRIGGSGTPTFAVYTLQRPPRVVVDMAGAVLDERLIGANKTMAHWPVNSWSVTQVSAYQISSREGSQGASAGQTMVRVVIAMARPASYQAKAVGRDVVVTVNPRQTAPREVSPAAAERAAQAMRAAEVKQRRAESAQVRADAARRAAEEARARAAREVAEAERRAAEARQLRVREEAAYREVARARAEAEKRATEAEKRAAEVERAGTRLSALQKQVATATAEVASMRRAAQQAAQRAAELDARKDTTERDLSRAREQAKRLAKARAAAEAALAKRQSEVKEHRRVAERLAVARSAAEAELAKRQGEVKEHKRAAQRLAKARAAAETELAKRQSEVKEHKRAAERLAVARSAAEAELAKRQSEVKEHKRAVARLAVARSAAEAELAERQSEVKEHKRAAQRLAEARSAAEAELAERQREVAEHRRAVARLAEARTAAETEIKALNAAATRAKQARVREQKRLAELSDRRASLEQQLGDVRNKTRTAAVAERAARAKTAAELQTLAADVKKIKSTREHEEKKLADMIRRRRVLERDLAKIRQQERAVVQAERTAQRAEAELQALDTAATKAREARQREEQLLAELSERRTRLERQLQRIEARAAQAEQRAQNRAAQSEPRSRAQAEQAAQRSRARAALRDLDAAAARARQARLQEQQRVADLSAQRSKLDKQLSDMRVKARAAAQSQRAAKQAEAQLNQLNAAVSEAKRVREREQHAIATLSTRRAALEKQVAAMRAQARAAATAKAALQGDAAGRSQTADGRTAGAQTAQSAAKRAARPGQATAQVREVEFLDRRRVARVIIDLSSATKPQVVSTKGRRAVLEFEGVELPEKLERTLDVRSYQGPIQSVSSYRDPGDDGKMRVVVDLAYPVKHALKRDGNRVYWDFAKPKQGSRTGVMARNPGRKAAASAANRKSANRKSANRKSANRKSGGLPARARSFPAPVVGGFGAASTPITQRTVAQLARQRRKVYRGSRIDLDLRDVDIHNVMRLLADVGGINIVIPDEVQARVTVRLRQVPWDQALEVILASKGLWYRREGNLYRIAPRKQLDAEDQAEATRLANLIKAEAPEPQVFTLNYSVARDMKDQISPLLSPKGRIEIDERTNALIINDVRAHRQRIVELLTRLDTQTPQIQIEARIVEARSDYNREIGVQWGGRVVNTNTGLVFPNDVGVGGGADDGDTNSTGVIAAAPDFAVNLPAAVGTGAGGALGFALGSLNNSVNLNLRLSALESTGSVRIISAPKITVINNVQAQISQGVSIPVSVISAEGVQTQFVPADLSLEVTPHVSQRDCNIAMDIQIKKNEPDFVNTGARGDPSIQRKEAKTTVLVADNETTVIGGVYTRNTGLGYSKVPFFGDLPIIGWLFKNRVENDNRTEVLVFITPRITNKAFLRCE